MVKKNNNSFWKKILSEDSVKQIFAWLSFILACLFIVSILSPQGILTSKVRNFLFYLFGWNSYLFIIFLIIIGYLLLPKPSWFKFLKGFLGSSIIFLIFNFYFHLIFREGGFLGSLIFSLNSYLGPYGLIFLSFVFLLFSLWLIFEEKFFEFLKKIFEKSQEKIEELEKTAKVVTVEEPIKQVRKEITPQNKIKEKIKIKTRKVFPKVFGNYLL
jgi:hypothetical protein